MRGFLLAFGWLSVIGSVVDAAIIAVLVNYVLVGKAALSMTVDAHVSEHLPFLYWARAVAEWVFPERFVAWLFGLQALVFFPARLAVSAVLGGWALQAARRMNGGV